MLVETNSKCKRYQFQSASVASEVIQSLGTFRKAIRSTHVDNDRGVQPPQRNSYFQHCRLMKKHWRISWTKNEQAVPLEHDDDNDDDDID